MSSWSSSSRVAAVVRAPLPMLVIFAVSCGPATRPAAEPPAEPPAPTAEAPAPSPAAPARSCQDAASNVAAFTQQVSAVVAQTVLERCTKDGWAQEVINCFAATQDGPELGLCTALLTPVQQHALETQDVPVQPQDPAADPACAELAAKRAEPARAAAPAASALPEAPTAPAKPAVGPAQPAVAPRAPTAPLRTLAPKELEQLRLTGETQIVPEGADRRLLARCRIERTTASFKLCVDAAGLPSTIETLRSSGLDGYDSKLLAAIAAWRYRPFLIAGKPAPVCSAVTFVYAVK